MNGDHLISFNKASLVVNDEKFAYDKADSIHCRRRQFYVSIDILFLVRLLISCSSQLQFRTEGFSVFR